LKLPIETPEKNFFLQYFRRRSEKKRKERKTYNVQSPFILIPVLKRLWKVFFLTHLAAKYNVN